MTKVLQTRQIAKTLIGSLAVCAALLLLLAAAVSFTNLDAGMRLVPVVRIVACAAGGLLCRTGSRGLSALNAGIGGFGVALLSLLLALAFGGANMGVANLFDAVSVIAASALGGMMRS